MLSFPLSSGRESKMYVWLRHDLVKHPGTIAAFMKGVTSVPTWNFSFSGLTFPQVADSGKQRQQLAALGQHGGNESDAGAACLLKRLQISPHELSEIYLQLSSGYTVHTRPENQLGDCQQRHPFDFPHPFSHKEFVKRTFCHNPSWPWLWHWPERCNVHCEIRRYFVSTSVMLYKSTCPTLFPGSWFYHGWKVHFQSWHQS